MSEEDNVLEVKPITPTNWPLMLAATMSTPLIDPQAGQHPRDPEVIWCPPLNSIGLSGIGKSHRIKWIARNCGINGVHTVLTSTKQPASFEGACVPTANGIVVECILPAARKCIQLAHQSNLIFFDEINGATPRTQGACMSALNDRQFGDHVIPPKTRMLAAMNPAKYSAGGFTFTAPMANRMGHVWYPTPPKAGWINWMNGLVEQALNLQNAEQLVIKNWDDQFRTVKALMTGFERRSEQKVFVCQPEPDDPESGQAWPSYRTWWWALCAITACRCLDIGLDTQLDFVGAYAGRSAQSLWGAWVNEARLPDPAKMLSDGWKPDNINIDVTYACLNNVTDYVVNMAKTNRQQAGQEAGKVWGFLESVIGVGQGDLTANCAARLHGNQLGRHGTPADTEQIASRVLELMTEKKLTLLATA